MRKIRSGLQYWSPRKKLLTESMSQLVFVVILHLGIPTGVTDYFSFKYYRRQEEEDDRELRRVLALSAHEALRDHGGVTVNPITSPASDYLIREQNDTNLPMQTQPILGNSHDVEEEYDDLDDDDDELARAIALSLQSNSTITPTVATITTIQTSDYHSKQGIAAKDDDADRKVAIQLQSEVIRDDIKRFGNAAIAHSIQQHRTSEQEKISDPLLDASDDSLPPPHLGAGKNQPRFLNGRVGFTYSEQYPRSGYFTIQDLLQPQFLREAILSAMILQDNWLFATSLARSQLHSLVLIRHSSEKAQEHSVIDATLDFGFTTTIIEVARMGWGLYHPKVMVHSLLKIIS